MKDIHDIINESKVRRAADAIRYQKLDDDECQICHAHGEDKRSWFMTCLYAVHEAIPEAIELADVPDSNKRVNADYYLRLCKSCRGEFLSALGEAANRRRALRGTRLDSDGGVCHDDEDRNIPIRVNGCVQMITREEWDAMQAEHGTREPFTVKP
jgi:hypothetical protein